MARKHAITKNLVAYLCGWTFLIKENMLFFIVLSVVARLAVGSGITDLVFSCYPNGTVEVTHPGSYSHCFAVQDEGTSSAVKCTVSTSGGVSLITGCSQDNTIVAFFSQRSGSVETFGSNDYISYEIECEDIPDSGVDRTVSNLLGATLEVTTQDAVTPSFAISSALREPDQLGSEVYEELVGAEIYWTIDIPSDYSASPTCWAYSGTSASGSPTKQLVLDGCSQDSDILGADFDSVDTSIPLIKRYYVNLYVFKFYNSDDVFFKCTVKLCPSGSTACDISCGVKKRSVRALAPQGDEKTFTTGSVIHIVPTQNSSASVIGHIWLFNTVLFMLFYRF